MEGPPHIHMDSGVVCVLGVGVTRVKVGQFGVLVGVCVKCWGSACVVRGSFVSIISLG